MAHTLLFRKLVHTFQEARRLNLQAEGSPPPTLKANLTWTRRRFVQSLTLAGGATLVGSPIMGMDKVWGAETQPAIAIIGGGIAGLNAAYQLKKAGLKATVYEANTRLGGRIQSVTGAMGPGLVSDLGGSLINTDHADMLELVKDFKLKLFNRNQDAKQSSFPATAYFFEGRMRSESEIAEHLRPLAEQMVKDAALIDQDFEKFSPQLDQLSVVQYLDQHTDKISEPFIRDLIENTVRAEYGTEPKDSSALPFIQILPVVQGQAVELLTYSDEVFCVEGGSGKIIEGLVAALPGQIKTGMLLSRLQSKGQTFRLFFSNFSMVEADYVILAIPLPLLRSVNLQTPLPPKLTRFIEEVNLGANDKLLAGFSHKVWQSTNGFFQSIWSDLGLPEAWDDTERQPEFKTGVLCFFFGGNAAKSLQSNSTQRIGQQFLQQFESAISGMQKASTGKFLRTQWSQNPFIRGSYTSFKPGQLTEFKAFFYVESDKPEKRQDVRVGNLIFAGEHVSDAFYGFMNGSAQTGRLAAQAILNSLKKVS